MQLVTPTTPGTIHTTCLLSLDALLTMVSSLSVAPATGHTPSNHTGSGRDTLTPSAGVLFSTAEVVSSGLTSTDGNSSSEPCLAAGGAEGVPPKMANPSELLNARQRKKVCCMLS